MGEINFFADDLEIKDQKIILRLDLNVPIKDKVIKDDTRITSVSYTHLTLPTTPYV